MRRQGQVWAVCVVACGMGAMAQQPSAPPTGQGSCQLVRDAYGNLVMDPACPQQPTAPASQAAPNTPQAPAAKRFPFPGEADQAPADAGGTPNAPGSGAGAPAGGTGTPAGGDVPAVKRFPYPGENDGAGTGDGAGSGSPGSGSNSSGSSSSSSSSSSDSSAGGVTPVPGEAKPVPGQPPLKDAGSSGQSNDVGDSDSSGGAGAGDTPADDTTGAPRRRTSRRKLPVISAKSDSEQEEEDVQVAGFYQNDGDFRGAYDRAKDAVRLDKGDPAAHLALAESARRLGKLDEAETEYKQCLGLDPVPKVRKVAERALKEMTGGGGS